VFLAAEFPAWSRTRLQRLIEGGRVLVDGEIPSPHLKLRAGQSVQITWPAVHSPQISKSSRPLPPIIYEDGYLLVINKPAGMVVHPAAGHYDGDTLVEIVAPKLKKGAWPEDLRPGLVHRLDRDTSGLILFAKTPQIQTKLSRQFAERKIKKTYLALVKGVPESREGALECRISRHPKMRQRFAVAATGRWAFTKFSVRESFGGEAALLELNPLTGRTHQLRVQLAAIGHPILGDTVYGDRQNQFPFIHRQMLHAFQIEFNHPQKDRLVKFTAPPPDDFQDALKLIRLNHP